MTSFQVYPNSETNVIIDLNLLMKYVWTFDIGVYALVPNLKLGFDPQILIENNT